MSHAPESTIRPGEVWLDSDGNPIESHLGSVLFAEGKYYWYGMGYGTTMPVGMFPDQMFSLPTHAGVTVYSSVDLVNWTFEGRELYPTSYRIDQYLHPANGVARPKVIRSDVTGKYVLMAQLFSPDLGIVETYNDVIYATSDSPAGPFSAPALLGWSTEPNLSGLWGGDPASRVRANDIGLFKDDDGTGYLLTAREAICVYKLADDFSSVVEVVQLETVHGEAPAVFKLDGRYHMLTSGLSGFEPNANMHSSSDSIYGPWSPPRHFSVGEGSETTFGSQVTAVLPVEGSTRSFVYLGDRFAATSPFSVSDFHETRHVWLPLHVDKAGEVSLSWAPEWRPTDSFPELLPAVDVGK